MEKLVNVKYQVHNVLRPINIGGSANKCYSKEIIITFY